MEMYLVLLKLPSFFLVHVISKQIKLIVIKIMNESTTLLTDFCKLVTTEQSYTLRVNVYIVFLEDNQTLA